MSDVTLAVKACTKVRMGDLLRLPGTGEWCEVAKLDRKGGIPLAEVRQAHTWSTLQITLEDGGTYPPDRIRRTCDDIGGNIIRGSE